MQEAGVRDEDFYDSIAGMSDDEYFDALDTAIAAGFPRSSFPRSRPFISKGSFSIELEPGAAEALREMSRPRCGDLLFPLPENLWRLTALEAGQPVHPLAIPYLQPVQGPQPVACLLDKGHRIGWHWHNGTWWRAS
jgi:hypothetical protein